MFFHIINGECIMSKKPDFVVVSAGSLSLDTVINDLVISKEIETATSKGRTQFKQVLKVKVHGVTLQALLSFVLRAVIIRFQQWVRSKGDAVGEKFMQDNPTYLHDISAALRGGTDTVETLKASANPMEEINKLIAAAGLQDKVKVSAIGAQPSASKPSKK